jgi:hypothetical protein
MRWLVRLLTHGAAAVGIHLSPDAYSEDRTGWLRSGDLDLVCSAYV